MELKRIADDRIVKATSSAAMANAGTAGGRLIPLIMIDASGRPEVRELIRVHEHMGAGDCVSQWATVIGRSNIVHLSLEFSRPVVTSFVIEFELPKLAGAIDNMLRGKSMYLLEGEIDSTFTSTDGRPRILIELPSTGFEKTWDRMFHRSVTEMLREDGFSRKQATDQAQRFVAQWRQSTTFEL